MDGGAWWAAVHGVVKSWTRLSDFTFTFHFHALEKEMATHSSILVWRIPTDRGAWQARVHGVAESDMTERLSLSLHLPNSNCTLEKSTCFLGFEQCLALGQSCDLPDPKSCSLWAPESGGCLSP